MRWELGEGDGEFGGSGYQLLRVGFAGGGADFVPCAGFYDAASVHYDDALAEVTDQRHGVRDEE